MNKLEGGNLKRVRNHVKKYHKLRNNSKGYPYEVNSFHNFSIFKLGKNFEIISESLDGEIEAIRHKYYKWLGLMWHPEREKKFDIKIIKIVKKLFSEGK